MSRILKLSWLQMGTNPQVLIEPKLPPELEKIIFSYAYQNNPKDVQNLVRVARRVEEWLCSSMFRVTLMLRGFRFPLKRFTLSTILRYGKYINHFALNLIVLKEFQKLNLVTFLFGLRRLLCTVLAACPNLVNLWIYGEELEYTKSVFPVFSPQITHLTIQLRVLLKQLSQDAQKSRSTSSQTSPALFPHITHLHTLGNTFEDGKEDTHSVLLPVHFPNLTHFAIATWNAAEQKEGMKSVLERCSKLQLVVVTRPVGCCRPYLTWMANDGRVIELFCTPLDLWKTGARGEGPNMWEMAERSKREILERKGAGGRRA